jgi:ABC-2 type transport system ATP-binding protein
MLSIESLSFSYADARVLDGVTLEISGGSVFGLLGPNGAGKTTLISILSGLRRPATGAVSVDGEPLGALRERRPHWLGLVPQELAFYPMLTVSENLRFFGGVQGLSGAKLSARVDAVVALAQLEGVLARRGGNLSGGLKRRLNLAIGLLTEPDLVLLDEPTVGVDTQSRAFLLESIAAMRSPSRHIIYTSHYMDEVEAICDHVAILDAGRVLAAGTLADLRAAHPGAGSLEEVFLRLTHRRLRD